MGRIYVENKAIQLDEKDGIAYRFVTNTDMTDGFSRTLIGGIEQEGRTEMSNQELHLFRALWSEMDKKTSKWAQS